MRTLRSHMYRDSTNDDNAEDTKIVQTEIIKRKKGKKKKTNKNHSNSSTKIDTSNDKKLSDNETRKKSKKNRKKKSRKNSNSQNSTSSIEPKLESPLKLNDSVQTLSKDVISPILNNSRIQGKRKSSLLKRKSISPAFKNIVTSTTIKPKRPQLTSSKRNSNLSLKECIDADEVINISDTSEANVQVLNSTFDMTEQNKKTLRKSKITNTENSGEWVVEKHLENNTIDKNDSIQSNVHNETFTVENNKENKNVSFALNNLNSTRKKWLKFDRNSIGAQSVLEQITTPIKKTISSARKSTNASENIKKTASSITKKESATKSNIKRTKLPNFALIHKKAFEKMESLVDYSNKKKERAKLLLSTSKKHHSSVKKHDAKVQLFPDNEPSKAETKTNINRFGFKLKTTAPFKNNVQESSKMLTTNIPIKQKNPVAIKPSVFNRPEVMAIANKKVQTIKTRENKRDMIKGVRTNRRFELLMKMRNN